MRDPDISNIIAYNAASDSLGLPIDTKVLGKAIASITNIMTKPHSGSQQQHFGMDAMVLQRQLELSGKLTTENVVKSK